MGFISPRFGILLFAVTQVEALVIPATKNETSPNLQLPSTIENGFVAEWEYKGGKEDPGGTHPDGNGDDDGTLHPIERTNPATWFDSQGTWWVFGGHGLRNRESEDKDFLGDLWAFNLSESEEWTSIFQPVHDDPTPLSSYPENLQHQILCGSLAYGHLAVFGGLDMETLTVVPTEMENDPLLREDNTVWLYDIPHKDQVSSVTDGLWTSYICCDACLPDKNTTLDFCPHFDHSGKFGGGDEMPLVMCAKDSIMALQPSKRNQTDSNYSPFPTEWWEFDLKLTEWVKLDEGGSDNEGLNEVKAIFDSKCRTASDATLVYIFCPSPTLRREREIYVIDTLRNSIRFLSKILLNTAFEDAELWKKDSSVLTALNSEDHTLLLVAYSKLLDFWIHDHLTGKVQPLENIWLGSSLNHFQHMEGFYRLHITFPSRSIPKKVYLLNPRKPIFNFHQKNSKVFHVRIQTDKDVFLPERHTLSHFLKDIKETTSPNLPSELTHPTRRPTEGIPTSEIPSQKLIFEDSGADSESNPIIPSGSVPDRNPKRISSTKPAQLRNPDREESLERKGRAELNSSLNSTTLGTEMKFNLTRMSSLPQKVSESTERNCTKEREKVAALIFSPHQKRKPTGESGKGQDFVILRGDHLERAIETTTTAFRKFSFPASTTLLNENGTTTSQTTETSSIINAEPRMNLTRNRRMASSSSFGLF